MFICIDMSETAYGVTPVDVDRKACCYSVWIVFPAYAGLCLPNL